MEIKVLGSSLDQWELGRKIKITPTDGVRLDRVEYCHANDTEALPVRPYIENGILVADIPNMYLQSGEPIFVYLVHLEENLLETIGSCVLSVAKRPKPNEYVYTETEVMSWQALDASMREFMSSVTTAYDVAVECGYEGTQEEWLASLKGERGPAGPRGATGPQGPKGDRGEAGGVATVNGVAPDENGNVQVETSAQADLNAPEGAPGHVLNRTHWVEQGMVEVLAETTIAGSSDVPKIPSLGLEAGNTYTVKIAGVEYTCVAFEFDNGMISAPAIGNPGLQGGEDNGMSFLALDLSPEQSQAFGYNVLLYTNLTYPYTVSVYQSAEIIHKLPGKFLPDGVPYSEGGGKVEVLPETTLTAPDPENDPGMFDIATPISLSIGERYTVNVDGTEYQGTAVDGATLSPDAAGMTWLFNDGADIFAGEGMVFCVMAYPPEVLEEAGYYAMLVLASGATTCTISIYQDGETIHRLDNKFLSLDWLPIMSERETTLFDGDIDFAGSAGSTTHFLLEIVNGKTYTVVFNGETHTCVGRNENVAVNGTAANVILLGNTSIDTDLPNFGISVEDTGEPFLYSIISSQNFAEPFQRFIITLDYQKDNGIVNTTVPLKITGPVATPNKLPEEFFPDSVDGVVIRSSTEGSTKKFKLTIDDSGTITATEVT